MSGPPVFASGPAKAAAPNPYGLSFAPPGGAGQPMNAFTARRLAAERIAAAAAVPKPGPGIVAIAQQMAAQKPAAGPGIASIAASMGAKPQGGGRRKLRKTKKSKKSKKTRKVSKRR